MAEFAGAIPTALTSAEAAQLRILACDGLVLELGAQYGASTIVLAQAAHWVHSVDWHQGDSMAGHMNSLEAYFTNLRRAGVANVVSHIGRFDEVLSLFESYRFDGCFLDGEHDRASVERDTSEATGSYQIHDIACASLAGGSKSEGSGALGGRDQCRRRSS